VSITVEIIRLFWARAQVSRSDPEGSSTFVFGGGRANDSGAFEIMQANGDPFPEAVEIYLDELGADEAVFTVIARSSEGEEATFPVIVRRSAVPGSITVGLKEIEGSGQSGVASLSNVDGQTLVVVSVSAGPAGASQTIHIHTGTCDASGGVEHALSNVEGGSSSTTVVITLEELLRGGQFAINLHDAADPSVDTACGNITIP